MANQHDHIPMRQFDLSAQHIEDFEALERLLKRRLALYGQEGERVLRGQRDAVADSSGARQRTRTFYAALSDAEAGEVLKTLDTYRGKYGNPTDEDYQDPGISISSRQTEFATGVHTLMDTGNLKALMDIVKSQGGYASFEKGGGNSGTLRWGLPSDLRIAGDRGKPVLAPASFRSRLREEDKSSLKKFQGLMQAATGKTVTKADILQLSDARRAKLRRDAGTVEAQKEQAENPAELGAVLGQKLIGDRLRKRGKAQALFKDSGYTAEQIAAGDFFDNDEVMDQIGSDVVGYPVAVQKGIRRARRRRADRDIEPEDYRRATYTALDRANASMRDKRAWREDHPDSPLATRMRDEEERRTPGTKAFERAEQDRLDRSSESRKAAVKWAKAHRGDPTARAILRGRGQGGMGRLLRGAGAAVKNTALMGISAALAAAVKFLSALPGVASDVHAISAKGNALDITDSALRGYRHMERITGMKEGSLAETFGALVHSMPDLTTGDSNMGEIIRRIAALSARDPNSLALDKTIAFGVNGGDPGDLWREYLNTAFRLAFSNVGHLGSEEDFGASLRNSLTVFDGVAPGMAGQGASLLTALYNRSPEDRALVGRVASGSAENINGAAVDGFDVYGALAALLGADDSKWTPNNTATTVEWAAAEETTQTWTELKTTVGEIKEGILVRILGATEGIAVWLRDILKTIMALPIFNGMFDAILSYMDEEDYRKNLAAKESLEVQALGAEASVAALGRPLGLITEADHAKALADWERGVGVPGDLQVAGRAGLYRSYIRALYDRKLTQDSLAGVNGEISEYDTGYVPDPKDPTKLIRRSLGGISRPFGWLPEQMAARVANKAAADEQPFLREVEKVITAPDAAVGAATDAAWQRWTKAREALEAATLRMPNGEEVVTDTQGSPIALRRLSDYQDAAESAAVEYYRIKNAAQAAVMQGSEDFEGFDDLESKRIHDAERANIPSAANVIAARVEADVGRREAQIESAVFKQGISEIAARAGKDVLQSVLLGEVIVSGTIKAEERTYAIELTDRNTNKTVVLRDIPNEVERDVDVKTAFNFLGQNRPATRAVDGNGE
jgi:hypothetical protein